jgi:hypothetical protein
MRGKYNQGTAFWFPELYLTMKVICTSQQENVAQSLSIHKTSLVTTGKFTASMRMEEFLQTILCRQNRCERSHLFLRAPQSTRISQAPNYRSYLGSRARTERRRRNQHHKKRC